MLQISDPKPAAAGARYYLTYYLLDSDGHALWYCKGACQLGVKLLFLEETEIKSKEFSNLLNGFNYDGKYKLISNAGESNRVAFWDLTFSVPKSLSVAYVAASREVQLEMDRAIFAALTTTLSHTEKNFGLSRRGAGGREWVPANLTFALFRHVNSREDQPQIHWHCLLMNLGVRQDGTIGTLQTKPLFEAKLALGAFFRHELRRELSDRLGLKTEHEPNSFHVTGVPRELCDANSKRRQQIKDFLKNQADLLKSRGLTGAKAAKLAAVETRGRKTHTSQQELFTRWREGALAAGWGEEQVKQLLGATFFKEDNKNHSAAVPKNGSVISQLKEEAANDDELSPEGCGYSISFDDWRKEKLRKLATRKNMRLVSSGGPEDNQKAKESERGSSQHRHDENERSKSSTHDGHWNYEQSKAKESRDEKRPTDSAALKVFKRELREATDKTFPENQTRKKVEKMAFAIGSKFDIRAKDILEAVDELHLAIHGRFFRVEWRPLFPNAPKWNPLGDFQTPRIVLRNKPRKWGQIYYSKPIPSLFGPTMELRIQQRMLFPKAPGWSPFSKLSVKALRFAPYREYAYTEQAKEKAQAKKDKTLNHS